MEGNGAAPEYRILNPAAEPGYRHPTPESRQFQCFGAERRNVGTGNRVWPQGSAAFII